jgi:hypothetical protein
MHFSTQHNFFYYNWIGIGFNMELIPCDTVFDKVTSNSDGFYTDILKEFKNPQKYKNVKLRRFNHDQIFQAIKSFPISEISLLNQIRKNFPHEKSSFPTIVYYLENILFMCRYMTDTIQDLFSLVLDYMLKLQVFFLFVFLFVCCVFFFNF